MIFLSWLIMCWIEGGVGWLNAKGYLCQWPPTNCSQYLLAQRRRWAKEVGGEKVLVEQDKSSVEKFCMGFEKAVKSANQQLVTRVFGPHGVNTASRRIIQYSFLYEVYTRSKSRKEFSVTGALAYLAGKQPAWHLDELPYLFQITLLSRSVWFDYREFK